MDKNLRHIAMIMDGNGRWAEARGKQRIFGHRQGASNILDIARSCNQLGIKYLTLYAFSTENWGRPTSEVDFLVRQLPEIIYRDFKETLHDENMRLRIAGRRDHIPAKTLGILQDMVEESAPNDGLQVILAFNYGGKAELVDAFNKLMLLKTEVITEQAIRNQLYLPDVPDIDLLIRTGGEKRLSNFMLWQCAYSEIYFIDQYWPDFDDTDLKEALAFYHKRNRRFGKV